MVDPNMGTWDYTYDVNGNLATQTDARGVTTNLYYDSLGHVITRTYDIPAGGDVADTADVTYQYSGSLVTQMTDGSGQTAWRYDAAGRMLEETRVIDGRIYTTLYGYDALGRLDAMTYPDGEVITYSYNTQGQIEQVAGDDVYLADAAYDPLGQPALWRLGNGVTQRTAYDNMGSASSFRPTSVVATDAGGASLQELSFFFDGLGRLDWWSDDSGSTTWLNPAYDGLNQLESVSSNQAAFGQEYAYDLLGNLTNRDGLGFTYPQPPQLQPHLPVTDTLGTQYEYDVNGNLITKTLSTGELLSYQYDAENRLVQVISNTVPVSTFTYDGDGQRVLSKDANGKTMLQLGDIMTMEVEEAVNVSSSIGYSERACFALDDGGDRYFVWEESDALRFKRLSDGGSTAATIASSTTLQSVAVDASGRIHVVWLPKNVNAVYYSRSDDGGATWTSPTNLSYNPYDPIQPMVVAGTDGSVHIVWMDVNPSSARWVIYHRVLNGSTWTPALGQAPSQASSGSGLPSSYHAGYPDVAAAANGQIYVVWTNSTASVDLREGEVYVRRWDGTGWTSDWASLSGGTFKAIKPAIAVDDVGNVHVAWHRDDDNDVWTEGEIQYRYKQSGSSSWSEVE